MEIQHRILTLIVMGMPRQEKKYILFKFNFFSTNMLQ
jgi:hypothetical protein